VVVAFDTNPALQGTMVAGVPVKSLDQLASVVEAEQVDLAVLAVPADVAQHVATQLVKAGIRGILNFAPAPLRVDVPVEAIDLSRALEQLAFQVSTA
jgi:redox-sensing transcriptional repressor